MRTKPKIGDVVRSKMLEGNPAGYIVDKAGIHVWVRFFDNSKPEDGDRWDVYIRRGDLEIISRGKS